MIIEIIGLVIAFLNAVGTFGIAYIVYRWTQRAEIARAARQAHVEWQTYNSFIFTDPEFAKIERSFHPFDDISPTIQKKIYVCFMFLNVAYMVWINSKHSISDEYLARSTEMNVANQLYRNREFVEKYVFPRGYSRDFVDAVRRAWTVIDQQGGPVDIHHQ